MGEAKKFKDFAYNLKKIRKQKRLSQTAIAKELGITPQTVSAWENGVSFPKISTILELSSILDTEPIRLLTGLSDSLISSPLIQEDFNLTISEQFYIDEILSKLLAFNIDGLEKINEYVKDLMNISAYVNDARFEDIWSSFINSNKDKKTEDTENE